MCGFWTDRSLLGNPQALDLAHDFGRQHEPGFGRERCTSLSADFSLQVAFVYCRLKLPVTCRLLAYHSTPINTLAQI